MMKPALHGVAILLAGLLSVPAWAQSDTTPVPIETPEQILVVGQRPGPGLWKVSKGDHVLWVFASYSPLPKKMEWRSQQVETILAQSQEILWPPRARMGFFKVLTVLPFVIGIKKNPDGARLKDVLPADVYARWLPLKEKYIGADDDIERERPLFAAETLFSKGLVHVGLTDGSEVMKTIDAIVKKHKIKSTSTLVELAVDDPGKMAREFKKSPIDDAACFSKTLERLETDIDAMRLRANAWAKGDLEGIQKLSYADREEACKTAMANSSALQSRPEFRSMAARKNEAWLGTAEKALAANASTFAVLPLKLLLDPKGPMPALEAKGYLVEKPE